MKKKMLLLLLIIMICVLSAVGMSYALWSIQLVQEEDNTISSSCFQITMTNELNEISLSNVFPISDEEGKNLTPYSFTITNTCDLFATYEIKLEILENSTTSLAFVNALINKEEIHLIQDLEARTPSLTGAKDSRLLLTGSLGPDDSEDYTLRLWIDDSATTQSENVMNTTFRSKVLVTAMPSTYSPVKYGITKLSEAALANEYQSTHVDAAKEKIHNKQAVNFASTAPVMEYVEQHDANQVEKNTEAAGIISSSYTFDITTGRYHLTPDGESGSHRNLTAILNEDFQNKTYYTCLGTLNVENGEVIDIWTPPDCLELYKINEIEVGEASGRPLYKISGYRYNQQIIGSDKSDKGLYEALDDYGTTYFYRGSVNNNNVRFANKNWKIIRINGDGSTRLIYSGSDTDNRVDVGVSKFQNEKNSPAYAGYMYGNTINSSYEENRKNEQNSAMKTYLDSWYQTNIENRGFSSYLADSGFCNDRSLFSGDGFSLNGYIEYQSAERNRTTPTLTCPNVENDLFTSASATIGNKALTYPVGLITFDEAWASGFKTQTLNSLNYLYSSSGFITMTPHAYLNQVSEVRLWQINSGGNMSSWIPTDNYWVRPVINLHKNVEIISGIGTANDPFVIK